jgi:hypothetical protein
VINTLYRDQADALNAEAALTDHLSIELFGMLHGAADGKLAIGTLALIALAVTRGLWWR